MNVVLDTNTVIASAWKSEGTCRRVLDAIFTHRIATCYVSSAILREYEETARDQSFRHIRRKLLRQLRRVKKHALLVEPQEQLSLLPDPDDDKFLELARVVEADYLITGDLEAFRQLRIFGSTYIVTPGEFLHILRTAKLL